MTSLSTNNAWQSSPFAPLVKIGQDIGAGPCLLACPPGLTALHCPFLNKHSSPASCLGPALSTALFHAQRTSGLRNQLQLSRSRDGCALPSCYGTSGDRWLRPRVLTGRGEGASVQA